MKPGFALCLLGIAFVAHADAMAPELQDEAVRPAGVADRPAAPILSGRELADYLRTTPIGQSPLGLLSPGARERFVASLQFSESGVTGFDMHELATALPASGIHRVLALFGLQDMTGMVDAMADPNPGVGVGDGDPVSPIERRYTALYMLEGELRRDPSNTEQELAQRLAAEYDRLFSTLLTPAAFQDVGLGDLDFLYRATHLVAFYTREPRYAADLMRIQRALADRDAATDWMYEDTLQVLVAARDFDRARELASDPAYPHSVDLPRMVAGTDYGDAPTVLAPAGDDWVRSPVATGGAERIVVVSHPSCHFSREAIAAIAADPELSSLLEGSMWLAPQDGTLDFGLYREWNRLYPDWPMVVAYRADEFPLIDHWGTPTFYFIREGEVVSRVEGWPEEGRKAELMAAMRRFREAAP